MVKVLLAITLFLAAVFALSNSMPTPDEERYFDKGLNRDWINWLNSVHYDQPSNYPCRYYGGNTFIPAMPKRNSELINSLLSLPKNMNDAGK